MTGNPGIHRYRPAATFRKTTVSRMALRGKVALVTGGAQGIGCAVVESLLKNEAKVRTSFEHTPVHGFYHFVSRVFRLMRHQKDFSEEIILVGNVFSNICHLNDLTGHASMYPQVSIVDLNQEVGEKSKKQLDEQFGVGNCSFIQCDVTNAATLRGDAKKSLV